jgi:hypothetical protein
VKFGHQHKLIISCVFGILVFLHFYRVIFYIYLLNKTDDNSQIYNTILHLIVIVMIFSDYIYIYISLCVCNVCMYVHTYL